MANGVTPRPIIIMAITEKPENINIKLDGVRIEQVQYLEYLGVVLETKKTE